MRTKVLFLTLKVFSLTGGIEKVNRIAGKALHDMDSFEVKIYSLHDCPRDANIKYFPEKIFTAFGGSKINFVLRSLSEGARSGLVILSHINLLSVGYLIKKKSPKTKIILFAHGIEIWKPLPGWKQNMLRQLDHILAVSRFTKKVIEKNHKIKEAQCTVLNNCLDPFLPGDNMAGKSPCLLKKYGLNNRDIILMTLTRLSIKEKYKGYEKVIQAIKELLPEYPRLKYLIIGKYEAFEKQRLDDIINNSKLTQQVIFTGFINDEQLAEYYKLAEVYVMPSKKEGFGIVFIEAMYYGLPVIGGNKDGSVDALCDGSLGLLVNPDDQQEITAAIKKVIDDINAFIPDRNLLLAKFSNETYRNNLKNILESLYDFKENKATY